MNQLQLLGAGLADGWTVREIVGLVIIGILTTIAWLKLRRMQFPPEWEHGPGPTRDPKENDPPNPPPPPA
jgi:hypothetical protein